MPWWTLRKLRSRQPSVRLQAVRELRGNRRPDVIAALTERLGDETSTVRLAAFEALAECGELNQQLMIRLLQAADDTLRSRVIRELAKLRDPTANTVLLDIIETKAGESDTKASGIIRAVLAALDEHQPAWRAGPDGERLLAGLWSRFGSTDYGSSGSRILRTINLVQPHWTETSEAPRTITPLLDFVGDGSVECGWEWRKLIPLACKHLPLIVAALSSDHWLIRRGASATLRELLYSSLPATVPSGYSFIAIPEASNISISDLAALLTDAVESARAANAASEFLRECLRFGAGAVSMSCLEKLTVSSSVEAFRYEDVWHDGIVYAQNSIPFTLNLGPIRDLARAELRKRTDKG